MHEKHIFKRFNFDQKGKNIKLFFFWATHLIRTCYEKLRTLQLLITKRDSNNYNHTFSNLEKQKMDLTTLFSQQSLSAAT